LGGKAGSIGICAGLDRGEETGVPPYGLRKDNLQPGGKVEGKNGIWGREGSQEGK